MEKSAADPKAGQKTTEFWKSIAVHVVAVVIMALGAYKESDLLVGVGALLMGGTVGSYSLSRGLAKKGTLLSLAFCVMLLPGCGGPGYVRAEAISGAVDRIVESHAAYLKSDVTLDVDAEGRLVRRAGIRDGVLLKKIVDEAKGD